MRSSTFWQCRSRYEILAERTLEAFYEGLSPFAIPFMALFDRDRLPARSTLSRFLRALTPEPVEALRTLFLEDLLARPTFAKRSREAGLWIERAASEWCSTLMARVRPPANALCPRAWTCLLRSVA
jgi:hypothetical protein